MPKKLRSFTFRQKYQWLSDLVYKVVYRFLLVGFRLLFDLSGNFCLHGSPAVICIGSIRVLITVIGKYISFVGFACGFWLRAIFSLFLLFFFVVVLFCFAFFCGFAILCAFLYTMRMHVDKLEYVHTSESSFALTTSCLSITRTTIRKNKLSGVGNYVTSISFHFVHRGKRFGHLIVSAKAREWK